MRIIKAVSVLGLLAMTGILIFGFSVGSFLEEGSRLLKMPWGIVSMVDLYTGFVIFSAWIVYREKSVWRSVIWVILMMVLGFFTASLYTLLAAHSSRNNWQIFWMGKHAAQK